MTDHNPTGQAFQQFEYLTLPLHVRSDYVERAWAESSRRVESRFSEGS